jgi:hypothetical protein
MSCETPSLVYCTLKMSPLFNLISIFIIKPIYGLDYSLFFVVAYYSYFVSMVVSIMEPQNREFFFGIQYSMVYLQSSYMSRINNASERGVLVCK